MTVLHVVSIHETLLKRHIMILTLADLTLQLGEDDFYWRCQIAAVPGLIEEALRALVQREAEWRGVVPLKSELGHGPFARLVLVRDVIVLVSINIVANGRSGKELNEVRKTDEEATILAVLAVHLLPRLHRPLARFVTPVTRPFFHAVGVPDLYQAVLVKIRICHYLCTD